MWRANFEEIWMIKAFVGIVLVAVAFVLLRFFYTCPKKLWSFSTTVQNLFFCSQHILYWGMLIVGTVLCFFSDVKIGLLTLGCFLVIYYKSIDYPVLGRSIPLLHNLLAGLVGLISLLLGLILAFASSLRYGFISVASVLLSILIVKCLMYTELWRMKKQARR